MYWQNRKDRVSEYICVRASGASERFLEFLIVLQLEKVNFFTINVKFKVILSSKGGGIFVQAIPPPKKVGGGNTSPSPPPRIYASAYKLHVYDFFFYVGTFWGLAPPPPHTKKLAMLLLQAFAHQKSGQMKMADFAPPPHSLHEIAATADDCKFETYISINALW